MGVRGIKLREGDYVVAAARAKPGKAVLTITENGYGKRSRGGVQPLHRAPAGEHGQVAGALPLADVPGVDGERYRH